MLRSLKTLYRREPLVSCLILAGAVNMVIGSTTLHWSLFALGLTTAGITAGARWLQAQRRPADLPEPAPRYFLTSESSQSSLPMLSVPPNRRRS